MPRKLTKEIFVLRSIEKHGGFYDYELVEYINNQTKVLITCPKHGEFEQTPANHLYGYTCRKCHFENISKSYRSTNSEFIKKAKKIHGDKYDYSKVNYINNTTNVVIICKQHGEFTQRPTNHLMGKGCRKCGYKAASKKKTSNTNEFTKKAIERHGNNYDYSQVKYTKWNQKVPITCKKHGKFWQYPSRHIGGGGCPKCYGQGLTNDEWISRFVDTHGELYDYSLFSYERSNVKSTIICKIHGEFKQTPRNHLMGKGCSKCQNKDLSNDERIEKFKKIHKNRYDYSKVEYKNNRTNVVIICPEHGDFKQTPASHLRGRGCKKCDKSRMETTVTLLLDDKNVDYIYEHKFDWLKHKKKLSLDFYLPDYNIAIECQGIQHFKMSEHWGGEEELKKIQFRDQLKKQLCEENGVKLYYIAHDDSVEEKLNEILRLAK